MKPEVKTLPTKKPDIQITFTWGEAVIFGHWMMNNLCADDPFVAMSVYEDIDNIVSLEGN